ncbi:hypothetical protein EOD43_18720 [Sphingomonas crocodyli]|uniref:Uncharacterized protein n=2 Tax=Sphingomonas crocodyli TaxID=1979270 RepID=A0A437LYT9_9SPHN|nr:hypothetical protein EOD43_18720 [Sphingomonas crocodyli]
MPDRSPDAATRARSIVEALGGTWHGTRGDCRCPAHADRSPSLSVRLGDRAILFHCFAGCSTEDVMAELRRQRLHDHAALPMPVLPRGPDRTSLARQLWRESVPIAGTPAQDYLRLRGLEDRSGKLRYNPATILGAGAARRALPAMIAAVESELGIIAVQRTFLDLEDLLHKPIRKAKRALGLLGQGAIRLAEPEDELGLAEGVEDALSAMSWFGTPTWALGGVERLALVAIPEHVRRIIVYADHGAPAARCYARALPHLEAGGREVVRRLASAREDWNDAWRRHLTETLAATAIGNIG